LHVTSCGQLLFSRLQGSGEDIVAVMGLNWSGGRTNRITAAIISRLELETSDQSM